MSLYLIIILHLLLCIQGSVLGPILYTMHIKPLSAIIDSHSIILHLFADDLQLQMSAPPDKISQLLQSMQSCICDVKALATANMPKFNGNKTELTLVACCLCYNCHSSTAPSYVTYILQKNPSHTCNTRSSSYTTPLLNRPAHIKATLGYHSISYASFFVWNSIPNDVKCDPSLSSSKPRLKTYLFYSAYKDLTFYFDHCMRGLATSLIFISSFFFNKVH